MRGFNVELVHGPERTKAIVRDEKKKRAEAFVPLSKRTTHIVCNPVFLLLQDRRELLPSTTYVV